MNYKKFDKQITAVNWGPRVRLMEFVFWESAIAHTTLNWKEYNVLFNGTRLGRANTETSEETHKHVSSMQPSTKWWQQQSWGQKKKGNNLASPALSALFTQKVLDKRNLGR